MNIPARVPTVPDLTPSESLRRMVADLKLLRVEELDHRDWHGVLHTLSILVDGIEPLTTRGPQVTVARHALIDAVKYARKNGLPVPNRDSE